MSRNSAKKEWTEILLDVSMLETMRHGDLNDTARLCLTSGMHLPKRRSPIQPQHVVQSTALSYAVFLTHPVKA